MKKLNLLGKRFGRLVVLREDGRSKSGDVVWLCKCDCGNTKAVNASSLKRGDTTSCGCYFKEKLIERNRRTNEYDLSGEYGKCFLSDDRYFLFDKEDYDKICAYYWSLTNVGYVVSWVDGKYILLHRVLTDCPDNYVVDHINHNPLDNRKQNLRICTQKQNLWNSSVSSNNTSGCRGVVFSKSNQKWHAFITVNGEYQNLGYYTEIEEAIKVRKNAEKEMFGEYANINY